MVADAYAACLEIARAHYENFPVASRLLPARMRPHIAAIYAFARGADDIADEPGRAPGERLALLDAWQEHLHGSPRDAVFIALADTRAKFDLPTALFDDLLSAFRQDVTTTRYKTWDEVLDYCRRSANPIGRLVLRVARSRIGCSRRVVGRGVHCASAHQLLARPGNRLGTGPALSARRGMGPNRCVHGGSRSPCDVSAMEDGHRPRRPSNA